MLLTQLNDWSSSIGRSFLYIFILVCIMVLAYYLTRFIGTKARGFSSGNLKIIEGLGVGQNSSVLLIKAGERFLLIGVTKDTVSYLTELNATDIELKEITPTGRIFDTYLNNILKGKKNER